MSAPTDLPALPEPWDCCSIWDTPAGQHRSFSAAHYDGVPCNNQLLVFTASQMRAYAQAALTAQSAEIDRLRGEVEANAKLARFGAWCAREFRDSLADVDGGSAQDAMERFGVIVKTEVTESCGEGCVCVEYGAFPHDCYKFPNEIDAAMKEQTNDTGQL